MRSAFIFCGGGPARLPVEVPDDALVIAADVGLAEANRLGVAVDLLVGDLDSVDPWTSRRSRAPAARCGHPEDKDATDLELAITARSSRVPGVSSSSAAIVAGSTTCSRTPCCWPPSPRRGRGRRDLRRHAPARRARPPGARRGARRADQPVRARRAGSRRACLRGALAARRRRAGARLEPRGQQPFRHRARRDRGARRRRARDPAGRRGRHMSTRSRRGARAPRAPRRRLLRSGDRRRPAADGHRHAAHARLLRRQQGRRARSSERAASTCRSCRPATPGSS